MPIACAGFDGDQYALFALGVLSEEDARPIREHLAESCPRCVVEVKRAAQLNAALSYTLASEELVDPPRRLKTRILAAISQNRTSWASIWIRWPGALAGSFALLAAIAVGWWIGRDQAPVRVVQVKDAAAESAWEADRQGLNRQIEDLRSQLAQRPTDRAATPPAAGNTEISRLQARLREVESAADVARQQAQRDQERVRQLEENVRRAESELASARRQRDETEARLSAAVRERTTLRQEFDRQLGAMQGRLRQLEVQNAGFQEELTRQRQRAQQSMQLVQFFSSPSIDFVRLRATQTGGTAAGHAYVAERSKVVFYASNLPALPAGRVYQLWLMRDQGEAVISGGIFQPNAQQGVAHEFANGAVISGVRALAVTDEPAGGSPKPTGRKFLVGTRS